MNAVAKLWRYILNMIHKQEDESRAPSDKVKDVFCMMELRQYVPGPEKCQFTIGKAVFETDNKYYPMKLLGRGSFGVVCSALDLETNEAVAIKKVVNVFKHNNTAASTLREMSILRRIKHDNIITIKNVMYPRQETKFEDVYMVLELMDTTLLDYMVIRAKAFSRDKIRRFMFEILCGINYLHSANILHRDLKPENILMDSKHHLKISDFGLSISTGEGPPKILDPYIGTRWYQAPELLVGNRKHGPPIDIWSAGCIFAEMLGRGVAIFQGTNIKDQLQKIINTLGKPKAEDIGFIEGKEAQRYVKLQPRYLVGKRFKTLYPKADARGLDLLEKMLTFDPRKRITAAMALRHPYMAPYWDPHDRGGPAAPAPCPLELDVDDDMDEKFIRLMMLREMGYYHS